MELFFKITAVILAGVAAYFLWLGNGDAGFATAVFAAVAFFLSVRFQVKGRLKQRADEEEAMRKKEEAGELTGADESDVSIENDAAPRLEASTFEPASTPDRGQRTTDKELL